MAEQLNIILVPHTHWDREWYQTFQQFRIRLVRAVDKLLDILDRDPDFSHFMLDGQTIVLDDYLEVRPEEEARLKKYPHAAMVISVTAMATIMLFCIPVRKELSPNLAMAT